MMKEVKNKRMSDQLTSQIKEKAIKRLKTRKKDDQRHFSLSLTIAS
jgi:hypothetical protein